MCLFPRIMPSLMFFVLFNAVVLPRMNYNGPFWRHCAESEIVFCRNNWWINFFLINNFFINRSVSFYKTIIYFNI